MPVCKKCMKLFKKMTPTHVKRHGYESLVEYEEDTRDIIIPTALQAEDTILREELRIIRSNKMLKSMRGEEDIDSIIEDELIEPVSVNTSLSGVLQAGFNNAGN